eukprot:scaffold12129_cov89-Isochrysis_galbana.AAC.5
MLLPLSLLLLLLLLVLEAALQRGCYPGRFACRHLLFPACPLGAARFLRRLVTRCSDCLRRLPLRLDLVLGDKLYAHAGERHARDGRRFRLARSSRAADRGARAGGCLSRCRPAVSHVYSWISTKWRVDRGAGAGWQAKFSQPPPPFEQRLQPAAKPQRKDGSQSSMQHATHARQALHPARVPRIGSPYRGYGYIYIDIHK